MGQWNVHFGANDYNDDDNNNNNNVIIIIIYLFIYLFIYLLTETIQWIFVL